ncbi:MAG: nitroreductase family protein [Acidimicrobiales bacterium]
MGDGRQSREARYLIDETSTSVRSTAVFELARSRRMTRSFADDPVDTAVVDALLYAASRAPSAGKTQAVEFLVLEGPEATSEYWDLTLPPQSRNTFAWPDLLAAPVLVVVYVDPGAYPRRYSEADKAGTGLGGSVEDWSTPYWWVDGGMSAMTVLLGAEEIGLGALFFGQFDHEASVKEHFGVPGDCRAIGTIALGRPKGETKKGRSADRPTRSLPEIVHRGRWGHAGAP